jgi:cell wall-associated NlpC family hydrolase
VASRLPSRASERRPAVAARAEPGRRKRPFERYAESARRLRARVMQSIADAPSVSLAGAGSLTETAPTLALARTKGDSIVALARAQIGTRYILGARAPGRAFDCSGFVQYLMAALNVSLPRTAHTQYYAGKPMRVDVTQLKPGDLLAFGSPRRVSHIAVYTGNGSFVHASSRAGQVVETPLRLERTGDGFFLFGAVRVLAQNDSGGSFTVADSLLDLRGLNFAPWP